MLRNLSFSIFSFSLFSSLIFAADLPKKIVINQGGFSSADPENRGLSAEEIFAKPMGVIISSQGSSSAEPHAVQERREQREKDAQAREAKRLADAQAREAKRLADAQAREARELKKKEREAFLKSQEMTPEFLHTLNYNDLVALLPREKNNIAQQRKIMMQLAMSYSGPQEHVSSAQKELNGLSDATVARVSSLLASSEIQNLMGRFQELEPTFEEIFARIPERFLELGEGLGQIKYRMTGKTILIIFPYPSVHVVVTCRDICLFSDHLYRAKMGEYAERTFLAVKKDGKLEVVIKDCDTSKIKVLYKMLKGEDANRLHELALEE